MSDRFHLLKPGFCSTSALGALRLLLVLITLTLPSCLPYLEAKYFSDLAKERAAAEIPIDIPVVVKLPDGRPLQGVYVIFEIESAQKGLFVLPEKRFSQRVIIKRTDTQGRVRLQSELGGRVRVGTGGNAFRSPRFRNRRLHIDGNSTPGDLYFYREDYIRRIVDGEVQKLPSLEDPHVMWLKLEPRDRWSTQADGLADLKQVPAICNPTTLKGASEWALLEPLQIPVSENAITQNVSPSTLRDHPNLLTDGDYEPPHGFAGEGRVRGGR